jgi:hypothetical protein
VARLRAGEIRDLAGDPDFRKGGLDQVFDLAAQFPNGKRSMGGWV